jgi:uncharacterized membrane protein YeaQ/YmgE (transglycosylase-associated protein family)
MGIISWAIWGLFVGLVARAVMPGRQPIGILWTILLGVVGSLIGGFVATEILDIADSDEFDFGSFLIAVATSVGLLLLYLRYFADRERGPRYGSGDR